MEPIPVSGTGKGESLLRSSNSNSISGYEVRLGKLPPEARSPKDDVIWGWRADALGPPPSSFAASATGVHCLLRLVAWTFEVASAEPSEFEPLLLPCPCLHCRCARSTMPSSAPRGTCPPREWVTL